MGLDISHGAFSAAYSAFNRFRQAVARAAGGGSFPPHDPEFLARYQQEHSEPLNPEWWCWGDDHRRETHPGLYVFFMHSDWDGEISPADCVLVANELEPLLPALDGMGLGGGHIEHRGGYGAVARQFIAGCREAAELNEPLVFC